MYAIMLLLCLPVFIEIVNLVWQTEFINIIIN